ncbi:substrate-binding periplasmic protein [Pseudodesulfovibrio sediminis]|uniref:Amino acid ABC transporter substrate-binding protein n=1 Tax=Pseudodesulfovibrio sediminis TaxID=2810563 RepID=A0ABN6EVH2_9BACT|nr:transporter substrate-binding domain-containing protein [Pseudodesulfovibrio sediminis]BCS89215.1 amino acid ABC transporter substrate-binding protein [Pseudodesulfovibrio sediminis]
MDKGTRIRWPFRLAIILVVLVSWVSAGAPAAHAEGSELQVITEIAPPSAFYDERGNLAGLAVEVVRAIQRELGTHTEIQVMPWARGYQELNKTPDIALFSTTRTPARERLFKWVGPLFTTHWVLYARKDSGLHITSLEDAKSIERIGVYRDDARAQFLTAKGFHNLDIADRQERSVVKLLGGRIDAVLYSDLGLKAYLAKSGTDPDLVEAVYELGARDLYIAFSMDTAPETVRAWEQAFARLEERGDLQRIREKWLP